MKKYVLILAVLLLFGLALSGCAKKATSTGETDAADTEDTAGGEPEDTADTTGTTGTEDTTDTLGGDEGTEVGMANPASVYCDELGFELEMREEAEGTAGYCKFPDGSECEEWAYYRGECSPGDSLAGRGEEPAETPNLSITQSDLDKLKSDIEGLEAEDLGGLSE